MTTEEKDYDVGYGKPPARSRFKPGQSGNPTGKRKKALPTFSSALDEAFKKRVEVTIDGKRRSVTLKEYLVESLGAKALKGDKKALRKLLDLREYVEQHGEVGPIIVTFSAEEATVL